MLINAQVIPWNIEYCFIFRTHQFQSWETTNINCEILDESYIHNWCVGASIISRIRILCTHYTDSLLSMCHYRTHHPYSHTIASSIAWYPLERTLFTMVEYYKRFSDDTNHPQKLHLFWNGNRALLTVFWFFRGIRYAITLILLSNLSLLHLLKLIFC